MAGLTPKRYNNQDIQDFTWLGDYDGLESAQSATLNAASFAPAGTHKLDNWLKSGTPLAIITAAGATQGQFALYDSTKTNGQEHHVGFLKAEVQLSDPVTATDNEPLSGAVLRFGQIIVNRLPVAFDTTPAAGTVSSHFIYR